MRALLSQVLDGTPVLEKLHRSRSSSWAWPASPRIEFMIALHIIAGWVAGDPRYGDPVTRLADTARQWSGNAADDAVQSGLEWVGEDSPAPYGERRLVAVASRQLTRLPSMCGLH